MNIASYKGGCLCFYSVSMNNNNQYHIGNRANAATTIKDILPMLESMIIDANKEFFSIQDTMRILSISRTQLYYLRTKGVLPFKRVGRKVYITKKAINNLVLGESL